MLLLACSEPLDTNDPPPVKMDTVARVTWEVDLGARLGSVAAQAEGVSCTLESPLAFEAGSREACPQCDYVYQVWWSSPTSAAGDCAGLEDLSPAERTYDYGIASEYDNGLYVVHDVVLRSDPGAATWQPWATAVERDEGWAWVSAIPGYLELL